MAADTFHSSCREDVSSYYVLSEASVFPLNTLPFPTLLDKMPSSPPLEKRRICPLRDETTFHRPTP